MLIRHVHFLFFWPCHLECGILAPQPGIEPVPPALEARSLNHWTAREFPSVSLFSTVSGRKHVSKH